jgi:peptide-methionine (S)-S-oxide reductase
MVAYFEAAAPAYAAPREDMTMLIRRNLVLVGVAALALIGVGRLVLGPATSAEPATVIPPPAADQQGGSTAGPQTVVLAGGCFWGVQAVFQHTRGVSKAVSGYAGGTKQTANYETVSSGRTGHAESVEVTFDPNAISLGTILQIYFSVAHDPTQLDRQGPDEGPQYRSEIFVQNDEQKRVAAAYIAQLDKAGVFKHPIVTKIGSLDAFYPAEAYHQDYATLHPENLYIVYNDLPKVENLKQLFPDRYQATPVLVTAARGTN